MDSAERIQTLRLIAMDEQDLAVISACAQDALLHVGDMLYQPKTQRFLIALHRLDWEAQPERERVPTILHFEHVQKASLHGFRQDRPDDVLNLLSIAFLPGDAPSGLVLLAFSGDCALRLEVECIEARLADLGPRWRCRQNPAQDGRARPNNRKRTAGAGKA